MCDAAKVLLRLKLAALKAHIGKKNGLILCFNKIEEKGQIKFKVSRRQEIKIRANINE